MDREAWRAIVRGVPKSLARLSDQHFHFHELDVPLHFSGL